MHSLTDLITVN